jgi:hypothetical protein
MAKSSPMDSVPHIVTDRIRIAQRRDRAIAAQAGFGTPWRTVRGRHAIGSGRASVLRACNSKVASLSGISSKRPME